MNIKTWIGKILSVGSDPVHSCDVYKDKTEGSCVHVDGPLCDYPKCQILTDYRMKKEGMTIAGNGAKELGELMLEQHRNRGWKS